MTGDVNRANQREDAESAVRQLKCRADFPNMAASAAGWLEVVPLVEGRQLGLFVSCWDYHLCLVATGILRLESGRSDPYSTCYRSHFHNPLAIETGVQTLLTIPAST